MNQKSKLHICCNSSLTSKNKFIKKASNKNNDNFLFIISFVFFKSIFHSILNSIKNIYTIIELLKITRLVLKSFI